MRYVAKERTAKRDKNRARIIVTPHYVGTEKNTKVMKNIILMQLQKKIKEPAQDTDKLA